jgi:hypothetical protein
VLVIAGIALAGLVVWRFVAGFEPATPFQAPGSLQADIGPGDYVIWLDEAGPSRALPVLAFRRLMAPLSR